MSTRKKDSSVLKQFMVNKSKEKILRILKECDDVSQKDIYYQAINNMVQALSTGDVDTFQVTCEFISIVRSIKTREELSFYHKDSEWSVEKINLIILSCKLNKPQILECVLIDRNIFNIFTEQGNTVSPRQVDGENHTAFYYAIRWNSVELIRVLVNKWPEDVAGSPERALSEAHEEILLRRVPMSADVQFFVEDKLLHYHLFPNHCDNNIVSVPCSLEERIGLVTEIVDSIIAENASKRRVDDKLLYNLSFIAKNIHILKRQMKSTYLSLPWEETEFCLVMFVNAHTKAHPNNLFYQVILNKDGILKHLKYFSIKLGDEKNNLKNTKNFIDRSLKRKNIVDNIIEQSPQFKKLYEDYKEIRDIVSLENIFIILNVILEADTEKLEGRLALVRGLQLIGESLKETLESPKLSHEMIQFMLLSAPHNVKEILINFRNSISHSHSFAAELENNDNVDFFNNLRGDINKIHQAIVSVMVGNLFKVNRTIILELINVESMNQMREYAVEILKVDLVEYLQHFGVLTLIKLNKMQEYIKELTDILGENKLNKSGNLLETIQATLLTSFKESNYAEYITAWTNFYSLISITVNQRTNHMLYFVKDTLKDLLKSFCPNNNEESDRVIPLLKLIYENFPSDLRSEDFKLIFAKIICRLFCDGANITNHIVWLEDFKDTLTLNKSEKKQAKKSNSVQVSDTVLKDKISCLQDILSKNITKGEGTLNFADYKSDKMLQFVLEIMVLDILGSGGMGTNQKPEEALDKTVPLLFGKGLRNHLAHNNPLLDILPADPAVAVLSCAIAACSSLSPARPSSAGRSLSEIRENYDKSIAIITGQEAIWQVLKNSTFRNVQTAINNGGDVFFKDNILRTALHYAAKGGNLEVIKHLIDLGIPVHDRDVYGRSPLHIAAEFGAKEVLMFLIRGKGFEADQIDKIRNTPMHYAALSDYEDLVKVLLKIKPNYYTIRNLHGITPLHFALQNGHLNLAKILLREEYDVDANKLSGGYTSLHICSEMGFIEMVDLLIRRKANVNARNDRNETPLILAVTYAHFHIASTLLLHGADVNARACDGRTPLFNAAINGEKYIVSLLIKHGALVNTTDMMRNTPLHCASSNGYTDIVKELLESNATVNASNSMRETPLGLAATNGNEKIVELLIRKKASLDVRDIKHDTPLHLSSYRGFINVVKILLERGAEINARNLQGFSPFLYAVMGGRSDIAEMFLQRGVDIDSINSDGQTALHLSVVRGHENIINLLISRNADINISDKEMTTPLHLAARDAGKYNILELLLTKEAHLEKRDRSGKTALHYAALSGNLQSVSRLIENNFDVNFKSKTNCTPLHLAISGNHPDIVKALLNAGAEFVTMEDENNSIVTPLSLAVRNNNKEMVEILIKEKADINAENGQALAEAVQLGFRNIVRILIRKKGIQIDPSLLNKAAALGFMNIVEILLETGIDINNNNEALGSPLACAVLGGHTHVAKLLLHKGADPCYSLSHGDTLLHSALYFSNYDIIDMLLSYGADINAADHLNRTAFQQAVSKCSLKIVERFLTCSKVDINAKGNDGWTVLHIAAEMGNVEKIQCLVSRGADVHARDTLGSKPVHFAAREGHKAAVEYFLGNGIGISDLGADSFSLLHYAAMEGKAEMVQYLIEQNIDINARNADGFTAVHVSAHKDRNSLDVITILLRNGAVYDALDNNKNKPVDITQNENISKLLTLTRQLFTAIKEKNSSQVASLVAQGAFVDALNVDQVSPLHLASWKGNKEIVDCLLSNGANPNVLGKGKSRPLHYASKFGHVDIVTSLLGYGAMYDVMDAAEKLPLGYASTDNIKHLLKLIHESFICVQSGNCQIIKKLKQIDDSATLRAVMSARNNANRTLVAVAIQNDFPKVETLKNIPHESISTQLILCDELLSREKFVEALIMLNGILREAERTLERNSVIILNIKFKIGQVFYKQTKYDKALAIFEELYSLFTGAFGENSEETLATKNFIGLIYHRLGKNDEALKIYQDILPRMIRLLGENHTNTLASQLHMGLVLEAQNKLDEAIQIYRDLYIQTKKLFGSDNIQSFTVLNNVSMVLVKQERLDEALEGFQQVYKSRQRLLGPEHSDTLQSLRNIADVLHKKRKYDEAIKMMRQVYDIQMKTLGPSHRCTVESKTLYADYLHHQGNVLKALKLYSELYSEYELLFGPNHGLTLGIKIKIDAIRKSLSVNSGNDLHPYMKREFFSAIAKGDLKSLKELIDSDGVDMNGKDSEGRTPLHFAVSYNHVDIVKMLLGNGADILKVSDKGNTPLHLAVLKGYGDILDVLLRQARENKHTDISELLEAKTIGSGTTCLHLAVKRDRCDMVKLLLAAGAQYNCTDKGNKTPVEYSTNANITKIFEIIHRVFESVADNDMSYYVEQINSLQSEDKEIILNARNADRLNIFQLTLIKNVNNIT